MKSKITSYPVFLFLVLFISQNIFAQATIVINEFMASNDIAIADQDGEFDDWIELYNNNANDIDISGYFLSDDSTAPMKFTFPDGTIIPSDSYTIIWCDDDQEQEGFHTGFKLSGGGEEIVLSDSDGTTIDYIDYGEQETDLSAARIPNGTGEFVIGPHTHNANNEITSHLTELTSASTNVLVYPNPAQNFIHILRSNNETTYIKIFDIQGKLHAETIITNNTLDVSHLPNGIYAITIEDIYTQQISIKR